MLLCNVEDQLAASKKQILALKKKLKEIQKAKDHTEKANEEAKKASEEAEQHGYDVMVVETKDAIKAEVIGVCRLYYAQVWDEALNQAKVRAFSVPRRAEGVYYPQLSMPLPQAAPSQTSLPR